MFLKSLFETTFHHESCHHFLSSTPTITNHHRHHQNYHNLQPPSPFCQHVSSWWFQPLWKNMSQNGFIFPNFRGEKWKKIFETTPPSYCCFFSHPRITCIMVWSPPTPPIATNGACHFCGTLAPGPKTSPEVTWNIQRLKSEGLELPEGLTWNPIRSNKDGWLEGYELYEWTLGLRLSSFTLSSNIAIAFTVA